MNQEPNDCLFPTAQDSFLTSIDFRRLLITLANSLDPVLLVPIWIQTIWHPDSVPEIFIGEFWKKTTTADNNKSMQNYPACK